MARHMRLHACIVTQVLMSADFYQTLTRDDVSLVPSGVASVQADGVTDGEGVKHELDVIVWATGTQSTVESKQPMVVVHSLSTLSLCIVCCFWWQASSYTRRGCRSAHHPSEAQWHAWPESRLS